jgi:hypothetical protein
VFSDDLTAQSALYGLYSQLAFGHISGGPNGISLLSGLSSDELRLNTQSEDLERFNENALLSTTPQATLLWNNSYQYIYTSNSLIEGLNNSSTVTYTLKNQLMGEALFIRAYLHFYLVNLFGKIPYITTIDYEKNTTVGRLEISEVYEMITKDLVKAKEMMSSEYTTVSGRRTRANSLAASALLAKVYLFDGKYAEAEIEASKVINNTLYELEDLNSVFLVNSREAIWQLENYDGPYTGDGVVFVAEHSATVSSNLIESFETGDLRLDNWILEFDNNGEPGYIPFKYKDDYNAVALNEYSTLIRLGEVHLTRAEARARLDQLTGANSAANDLDIIRDRAGLDPVPVMTKDQTLDAILLERRHELFIEFGARWIDLKRFGKADDVLAPIKSDWEATDVLYPLPYEETLVNKNLTQNDGYN